MQREVPAAGEAFCRHQTLQGEMDPTPGRCVARRWLRGSKDPPGSGPHTAPAGGPARHLGGKTGSGRRLKGDLDVPELEAVLHSLLNSTPGRGGAVQDVRSAFRAPGSLSLRGEMTLMGRHD